ncbi:DUF397 domain-containing protein [Actinomadura physcomitrii]|uniref:DUF397 domain-containing protein n=1 Tax=Actinomadura physcomitrii TaxID=2650748 RepID=UPI002E2611AA
MLWRKSTYSDGHGGECVEVAAIKKGLLVRDSKNPNGPVLGLNPAAARDFINYVRAGCR